MKFSPCVGECTDEGTHCEGCGRTHEEVTETRELVNQVVQYAFGKGYENLDEYARAMGKSIQIKMQNSQ